MVRHIFVGLLVLVWASVTSASPSHNSSMVVNNGGGPGPEFPRRLERSVGMISTIAGTGVRDDSGDGGLASLAQVHCPFWLDVDQTGDIYFGGCQQNKNHVISKSTGIISTYAGTGSEGSRGDGGLAVNAQLGYAIGGVVDMRGNFYTLDHKNHMVRKITSTGIISTVAGSPYFYGYYDGDGGPATNAALNFPSSLAVDRSMKVFYIGDSHNNVIRMVNETSGIITTYAGKYAGPRAWGYSGDGGPATSATLGGAGGLAVDPVANILCIADNGNNRVRCVARGTGIISTFVGSGSQGYSGDGGAATLASLNTPRGLAFDPSGNLYFTDLLNSVVRVVTKSTGIISTIAGTGTAGYSGDGAAATLAMLDHPVGIAIDSVRGLLYIADNNNNRIRQVTIPCPAGSYHTSASCALCLPGTYNPSVGSTVCTSCPTDSYTSAHGATACNTCAAGTHARSTGASACTSDPPTPVPTHAPTSASSLNKAPPTQKHHPSAKKTTTQHQHMRSKSGTVDIDVEVDVNIQVK